MVAKGVDTGAFVERFAEPCDRALPSGASSSASLIIANLVVLVYVCRMSSGPTTGGWDDRRQ